MCPSVCSLGTLLLPIRGPRWPCRPPPAVPLPCTPPAMPTSPGPWCHLPFLGVRRGPLPVVLASPRKVYRPRVWGPSHRGSPELSGGPEAVGQDTAPRSVCRLWVWKFLSVQACCCSQTLGSRESPRPERVPRWRRRSVDGARVPQVATLCPLLGEPSGWAARCLHSKPGQSVGGCAHGWNFLWKLFAWCRLPATAVPTPDPGVEGRAVNGFPPDRLTNYPSSGPSGFIHQQAVALKCTSGHFKNIMLVSPGDSSPWFRFSLLCSVEQLRDGRFQITAQRPLGFSVSSPQALSLPPPGFGRRALSPFVSRVRPALWS